MSASSVMSCFFICSLTLKMLDAIISLSFFIASTPSSILTVFASSSFFILAIRYSFFLMPSFCFLTASLSSTGHMGHPAAATPTSPNRMMVGGGAGGGGSVLTLTLPSESPSGDVTANDPMGGLLT
eukprot:CAMPEP_0173449792 /NCGR_PEP_ID=MMETSP1357-20121228/43428_1 /TAXON_ID=77926 /ORGANISM="Hemiselmis rufescens, Strain PCC563" /LENGTH=125 /DNA_ID=CAMNT_0014416407 /DNA_START=154 /DNA_END=531 /DNA_ORIENTATION=-